MVRCSPNVEGEGFTGLKQHHAEIVLLCDLAPPTASECNTTVVNTDLVC